MTGGAAPLAADRRRRDRAGRPPSASRVEVARPGPVPAVRRPLGERRDRRPVAGPRPDAPARRRPAPDQQRRRRLELRDARARQADPHVRRGGRPRRPDHRPPGAGRASASRRSTTSSASSTPRRCSSPTRRGPLGIAGVMGGAGVRGRPTRRRDVVVESAIFDPVSIRRTALPLRPPLRGEPAASRRARSTGWPGSARTGRRGSSREWAGGDGRRRRASTPHPVEPGAGARRVPAGAGQPPARARTCRPTSSGRCSRGSGSRPSRRRPATPVTVAAGPEPLDVDAGRRRGARSRSSRPGGATSRSRRTSPRRSPGSAATSSCPPTLPHTPMPPYRPRPARRSATRVRETLAGAGLTEVVTHASSRRGTSRRSRWRRDGAARPATSRSRAGDPIAVTNPLSSEHSVLRQSLLGSLLEVVVDEPAPRPRRRRDLRGRQGLRRRRRRPTARVVAPRRSR